MDAVGVSHAMRHHFIYMAGILITCRVSRSLSESVSELTKLIECKEDKCRQLADEVIKYIKSNLKSTNATCQDPVLKYCARIISREQLSLVEKKAADVKSRRETIFFHKKWEDHNSIAIRQESKSFSKCCEKRMLRVRNVLKDRLRDKRDNIAVRNKDHKFIYLVPQIIQTDDEIDKELRGMDISHLCYHLINERSVEVVDRMYADLYLNRSDFQKGIFYLKNYFDLYIKTFRSHINDTDIKIKEYLDNFKSIQFESCLPVDLYDDSLLDRNFAHDKELSVRDISKMSAPHPWSILPLYPDAVIYDPGANTVYISPTFFEAPLFHLDLPVSWNLAGLEKVLQAIFAHAPPGMKESFDANLMKFFPDIKDVFARLRKCFPGFPSPVPKDLAGNYFKDWSHHLLMLLTIYSDLPANMSSSMKESHVSLAQFRYYNDQCMPKPKNEVDLLLLHRTTGRMHGLLYIYAVHNALMHCDDFEPIHLFN